MGIWMDAVHEAQDEVEAFRARAESAEADLAAARADLSALAPVVGSAVVAGALAPGESLSQPSGHIIVSTVSRLRARAEAAERELASVLSDWNAVRDASGSKTNGGLAGHVAQLRARAERLEAALPLARYGLAIIEAHREDCGDISGDTLQDEAERCGLLTHVTVTEPCGDECRCAEYYAGDEWPVECLRYSPAARAAFAALADPAPEVPK